MPKYSPKERVRVNDPRSWYRGRVGVIAEHGPLEWNGAVVYTVLVESETGNAFISFPCREEHLEKHDG